MNRRTFSIATTIAALTGCAKVTSPSTPPGPVSTGVKILQTIISLSSAALDLIAPSLGISAALLAEIKAYISSIGTAVNAVAQSLASGSVLSRADSVIQALAALAIAPAFVSLIPGQVASIITAISAAIDSYVRALPTTAASIKRGTTATPVIPEAGALKQLSVDSLAVVARAKK